MALVTPEKRQPQYAPNPKEKAAIEMVMRDRDMYYQATRDYRMKWREAYNNYKMQRSETRDPYRANVFVPVTFWTVNSIVPRLVGQNPTITAYPVDEADVPKARFLSRILDIQWRKDMRMFDRIVAFAKSGCLFGTSVMKLRWQSSENEEKYDGPMADVLNLFDFYVNPLIPSIEDQRSVIHRSFLAKAQLSKDMGYKNIQYLVSDSPMNFDGGDDKDSDSLGQTDLNDVSGLPSGELVEVLEWWSNDRVVTIGNPSKNPVLIRDQENPYEHGHKPFVVFRPEPDAAPNRFYGAGVGEELLDIQDTVNTTMNQIIDNINLSINSMMKVRRTSNIHAIDLVSRPGGVIHVDRQDDIEPLSVQDRTGAAQNLQQQLLFYAQNMTGSTDLARGVGASDTATGVAIRDKNIGSRFNLMLRSLEEAISHIGELIAKMDMQFLDKKKTVRMDIRELTNDELELFPEIADVRKGLVFIEFDKDSIKGNYDIEVKVDSTISMDKGVLQKQLLDFLSIAGSDPTINLKREEIYTRILEFMGFSDAGNLFEGAEEKKEEPGPPEGEATPELPSPQGVGAPSPVSQLTSVLQSGQQI